MPITAFYIRRFFRIAPLFYTGFLFYNLVYMIDSETPRDWKVESLVHTCNIDVYEWMARCLDQSDGASADGRSPFEMSFYLMVPLLFRYIGTLRAAISGTVVALIGAMVCKLALTKILPRIAGEGVHDLVNGLDYYWLPTQMPIFLLGITLYLILKPSLSIPRELIPRRFFDGCLLLFISLYLIIGTTFSETNLYLGHMLTGVAFVLLAWSVVLVSQSSDCESSGLLSRHDQLIAVTITHFAVLKIAEGDSC